MPRPTMMPMTALALFLSAGAVAHEGEYGCLHGRLEHLMWVDPDARTADFDPATGQSLLNYAPDTPADFLHTRLDLLIEDMNTPVLSGVATHRLAPVGSALEKLRLDANLLTISAVRSEGRRVAFEHDGHDLHMTFDPPVPVGEEVEVVIEYTAQDPPYGLTWTPESDAWAGRPAQIHTQGQPETNSYWFPCHDFPNDRLTTEIDIIVPEGYVASSNGQLVDHSTVERLGRDGSTRRFERFHWLQEPGHPNYLVSLIVGRFDVVELGTPELPMPVYVPPGRAADVQRTYGNTARMLEVFTERFDEPYPWARYAQLVVWNFGAGGMENTAATTMYDTAIFSEDGAYDHDLDGLIAHELAHQWFGDLLTCRTWEHIWLNEGFATYSESLWFEARDGYIEGYLADTLRNFDSVIERDRGVYPDEAGMVSKRYEHPWEVFRRGSNPYPKGASILHMLRLELGDAVFFDGLAQYLDENRLEQVETDQFRKVLERVSGASLERFFGQWCERPGIPRVRIDAEWVDGRLTLGAEQTQTIDRLNPAFDIEIPVRVGLADGTVVDAVFPLDTRAGSMDLDLSAEPVWLAVDPDLRVLAEWTVQTPAEWMAALAASDQAMPARVQAVRALVRLEAQDAAPMLRSIAMDAGQSMMLREEAARAAVTLSEATMLADLLGVPGPMVRLAALEAADGLIEGKDDPALAGADAVLGAARGDRSARVRQRALVILGRLGHPSALETLLEAARVDSQNDRVRQGALEGLGLLGEAAGLPTVLALAAPGTINRTRPVAISAAVRLAEHDPDAVLEALRQIVETDRERRSVQAAASGLVDLRDPRGLEVLLAAGPRQRDPLDRDRFADLARDLEEKLAAEPVAQGG